MKDKKIFNIYIDYKVPTTSNYLGNSFPPLIYNYFNKNSKFNVYSLNDSKIPNIDFCFIMNGGSHWTYRDFKVSNFSINQLLIWTFPRFHKIFLLLAYIFKLPSSIFFKRHMLQNSSYEKHLTKLKKKNPNMKIIHRLDGIYQVICKVYGYDKSVIKLNQMSDLTIYQSRYSKDSWEKGHDSIFGKTQIIKPQRSIILNNGVSTDIFNTIGKKLNLQGKWKILSISASPSPKKGLFRILELANSLKDNKDFIFYLIGNQNKDPIFGKYLKNYKNIIHLDEIKDRKLLSNYYRSCDIFVFPSEDDCSPNVILEAMASGLPILTVDSGGIKELIEKNNLIGGLYIDDKNPVMNLQNIIKFYDKFKFNALEIIKNYHTNDLIGLEYEKIIESLREKS
tara:strand:+ start:8226 stop:9407 length:1182 start_codon:yes stop_codon:yes gene_type:complete